MAVSPQHFTQVDGMRLQFRMRGDGPPLLMLHGWGGSSLSFMGAASALEQRFRILAPDLPGFGFSEAPKEAWGSADYARAVAALPAAAGFEAVDVIGHSFGGKVALALARDHPERVKRLVIVASPIVRLPAEADARRRSLGFALVRGAARVMPRALRERTLGWARERFGSADYRAAGPLRPTLVRVVNEDWGPALTDIQAPVLLVWGENDTEVPLAVAQEAHARLPDAQLAVIEGAGHFPFLDKQDAFVEAVTRFLAGEEAPGT